MKSDNWFSLKYLNGEVVFLDQTKLPAVEEYIHTQSYLRIADAIKRLEIRGAPLIGIAAAYAVALSVKEGYSDEKFNDSCLTLAATRPTAVNLFNCLNRMKFYSENLPLGERNFENLISEAIAIHKDDEIACEKIAENGIRIFKPGSVVLTHCNTGKLATGGIGTAFGVILHGFEAGLVQMVFADETRPLFQGLRLTSYELLKSNIPFKVIPDSSAGVLIRDGKVDLVITGADRIASNGDSANKLGTFTLSVLCKEYGIPFYIAAPSSTIDLKATGFNDIPIEERSSNELLQYLDPALGIEKIDSFNPSFDVTPAENITGIITEKGFYTYPYNFV
jgi:methylthioribose-1-phosphate isomerase